MNGKARTDALRPVNPRADMLRPVYEGRRAVALSRYMIAGEPPILPGDQGTVQCFARGRFDLPQYYFTPDRNPAVRIWFEPWLDIGFRLL